MLAGAGDGEARRIFDELHARDAKLAVQLATEWYREEEVERWSARLAHARERLRAGDLAAARAVLPQPGLAPVEMQVEGMPTEMLVDYSGLARELGDALASGGLAQIALRHGAAGSLRLEALLLYGMAKEANGDQKHDANRTPC